MAGRSSESRRPSSGAGARRTPSLSSASTNPLSGQDEMALSFAGEPSFSPFSSRSSTSRRSSRGAAASAGTNGDAVDEDHPLMVPSARRAASSSSPNGTRNEAVTRRPAPSSNTDAAGRTAVAPPDEHTEQGENELFFDAGDALAGGEEESAQPVRAPPRPQPSTNAAPAQTGEGLPSYDFERQSYFSSNAVQQSSSNGNSPVAAGNQRRRSSSYPLSPSGDHRTNPASSSTTNLQSFGNSPNPLDDPSAGGQASTVSRARLILGRFGRFVGMRVPGAVYSTLSQSDQDEGMSGPNGAGRAQHRRRVMGGGLGQDGVFGNLNAKPDRRRRRRQQEGDGTNNADRGDDDDLEDDALPPTYETAAADSAPPYWETTIIGGPGSLHPLAPGGLGWTPGSPVVGAIEDLILEGLPIGNLFGLAWNLLVSTSFQFVGFLLTYLLHTTHAAKTGSWAGLGITLVQYGYYLRTSAAEQAHSGSPHTSPTGGAGTSHADQLAHDGDNLPAAARPQHTSTAGKEDSNDMLSFVLMLLGWFILLSSLFKYFRIYRWGYQLVATARREQAAAAQGETDGDGTQEGGQTGTGEERTFVTRFRDLLSGSNGERAIASSGLAGRPRDAEDWVIFPGQGRRLTDLEEGRAERESEEHLSPEEARLLSNLRLVGLTN